MIFNFTIWKCPHCHKEELVVDFPRFLLYGWRHPQCGVELERYAERSFTTTFWQSVLYHFYRRIEFLSEVKVADEKQSQAEGLENFMPLSRVLHFTVRKK